MKAHTGHGSALIIVLILVSLVAILLVGFVGSMRLEIFSARSHLNGIRAALYAQAGIDTALTRLNASIGGSATQFWVSQPGRLVMSKPGTTSPVDTAVELSSGSAPASSTGDEAANLNLKHLEDPTHYIVAATNGLPMKVKWLYVHQNGTMDTAAPPAYSAANPVVGRYAFWVDDNSARINVNTAWSRSSSGNTNALSHPSRVDLSALPPLTPVDSDAIAAYRLNKHFFNSVCEFEQVNDDARSAARDHSFALTHFNYSLDLNMLNEPRIVLTTQQSLAGTGTNFLNILNSPDIDPGILANLNPTSVSNVINLLYSKLTRTDWPMLTGKSFAGKYAPAAHPERAIQVALDIVDYVRSVESPRPWVHPIRGFWDGSKFVYATGGSGPTYFIGNSRRPCITEVGAYVPTTKTGAGYTITYLIKFFLPPQIGVTSGGTGVNLNSLYLAVAHHSGANLVNTGTDLSGDAPVTIHSGPATLLPGQSAVATFSYFLTATTASNTISAVVSVADAPGTVPGSPTRGARLDITPMSGAINYYPAPGTITDSVPSMVVTDPFVNKLGNDWMRQAGNTFTITPALTGLGVADSSIVPQQDTDTSGNLSGTSIRHPAPKGTNGNLTGVVSSTGDLGFIHTGIECSTFSSSVRFRTLRLQPQSGGNTVLPDWALLDLFTVPSEPVSSADKPYVQPATGSTGGRLNVNSQIVPFVSAGNTPLILRTEPLSAVFLGTTTASGTVSATLAAVLASNVCSRTLATAPVPGVNYGAAPASSIFFSPGQIVEIQGIGDSGESGEALVRDVLSLTTTRGSVFSIYSVGQAIRQTATGISVLAESRSRFVVERVVSGTTVQFLPVASEELKP